jgi:uncharacterized protein YfaP (DUF2135 family)
VAASGNSDITVRLTWSVPDDLDLLVVEPSGEEISFINHLSESGGELDRDANAGCSLDFTSPIENIFWPDGRAPQGDYLVKVYYYLDCDDYDPINYRLRIISNDRVVLDTTATLTEEDEQDTYSFTRLGPAMGGLEHYLCHPIPQAPAGDENEL